MDNKSQEFICMECLKSVNRKMTKNGRVYCRSCFMKIFVSPEREKNRKNLVDPDNEFKPFKVDEGTYLKLKQG